MKKTIMRAAIAATLCLSMLGMTSCIGSFGLTNRLLSWNRTVSNKFVNELVFFAFWVLPVYEVSLLADVVVINSIEFWSGTNPMASGRRVIDGHDGRYLVDCDGRGYTITSENDGSTVRLDFDADEQTWSWTDAEGDAHRLLTFVDDTHVLVPVDATGATALVELSQQGLLAYKAQAAPAWAAR